MMSKITLGINMIGRDQGMPLNAKSENGKRKGVGKNVSECVKMSITM
jgi:hypothetical protein